MAAKQNKKPAPAPAAAASEASEVETKKPRTATFDEFAGDEVNVPDIDGWYSPEKGEAGWVGVISGSFKKRQDDGKVSDVIVVRLLSDCSSAVIDGEPIELKAGQCMAVGIKAKLVGLLDYLESRARVAVRAKEKIDIGNGRKMWTFDIKGQKGARKTPQAPSQAAPPPGDDVPW